MQVHLTARKFRAAESIKAHAVEAVKKLDKFYDGIVRADVILSYERPINSVKTVEVNLHVFGSLLTAKERSNDFYKSIDLAVEKLEHQLDKYKGKIHLKNKKALRRVKERNPIPGEDTE
jgi:putative sigma-54 modulation protein